MKLLRTMNLNLLTMRLKHLTMHLVLPMKLTVHQLQVFSKLKANLM